MKTLKFNSSSNTSKAAVFAQPLDKGSVPSVSISDKKGYHLYHSVPSLLHYHDGSEKIYRKVQPLRFPTEWQKGGSSND